MYDMNSAFDMCRIVNDYQHQQFGALAAHVSRTQTDYLTQREHVENTRPLAQLTSEELQAVNRGTDRDPIPASAQAAMMHDIAYYHPDYINKHR